MSAATATQEKTTVNSTDDAHRETITKHVLLSMGMGAVPIPIVDILGLTSIQTNMVREIAKTEGDNFKKKAVTSVITALLTSLGTKGAATGVLTSLVKSIPVAGTLAGAVTFPVVAGATTFALGQVFVRHYQSGGNLTNLDPASAKQYFSEQFEKGKEKVAGLKKSGSAKAAATPADKKESTK